MGFGLLLCAYFLFTFMSVGIGDYAFITYLVGAMVAARAIGRLQDYNPRFKWLYPPLVLYALLAVFSMTLVLDDLFLWNLPLRGATVTAVVGWVQFVTELSFTAIALYASAEIAASVDLERHRARGVRDLVFLGVWGVTQLVFLIAPAVANAGNQTPMKLLTLYQLLVYLLCTWHFYACFSAICPRGEEFGRPSKPSRFAFINRINEKLDANNEKARLEYEQMMADRAKKYSAKNNNRHHKKKK